MPTPKYANHLDLDGHQIQNAIVHRLDVLPAASATNAGQFAYFVPNRQLVYSDGVSWLNLNAAAIARTVRLASTANLPLATSGAGTQIDGVAAAQGDRIVLKDQTNPAENGIYTVGAAGAPLVRATDSDTAAEFPPGTVITATAGTAGAGRSFITSPNQGYTLGTDPIPITAVAGPAAQQALTAGTGITITANAISVSRFTGPVGVPQAGTDVVIAHGLNLVDPPVVVVEVATNNQVLTGVTYTDANNLTLGFAVAPTAGQYRVAIG